MKGLLIRKGVAYTLVAFGLISLSVAMTSLAKDLAIWVSGQRCAAEAVDIWVEQVPNDTGAPGSRYYLGYECTTLDGRTFTGTSRVAPQEWSGLGMGETARAAYQEQASVPTHDIGGLEPSRAVAVIYFPLYPAHNRLDESRLVPVLACSYTPLVLLGCGSLVGWCRLLQDR